LEPSERTAVSTYLELFILIAVAIGGSALVYAATYQYQPVVQGPGVTVSQASIRQGLNQAVERMIIANTGTVLFNSFTISTVGIANAQFYVALTDAASGSSITPPLPQGTTGDNSIAEGMTISPGQTIVASITIASSGEFSIGQSYTVVVSISGGALTSVQVQAVPA
jgi:hypothetical protein